MSKGLIINTNTNTNKATTTTTTNNNDNDNNDNNDNSNYKRSDKILVIPITVINYYAKMSKGYDNYHAELRW